MRNFRPNNRDREFSGNRSGRDAGKFSRGFSGGRSGERSGFRNRNSGSFERGRQEMHKVTCDKCKKQCEVPFKPTGNKPVLCSDCYKKESGSGFSPSSRNNSSSSGISQEQYKEINIKLDKILEILEMIEFEDEDSEDDSENE
ncbi:MAG: CxxC-x17-CxxC domain-containing protein [Candidatus Pacearchaeota archaeon]